MGLTIIGLIALAAADDHRAGLYAELQQALRSLANAAQMVQRNPHLFQLRLLQGAGQQTGTTIIVGMPQGTAPIPLRDGSGQPEALPPDDASSKAEE